jgi:transposase
MSDLREAAAMALYALELECTSPPISETEVAMAMLKDALAQPEPTRSQQMRDAGYTRRPRQLPKENEQEPVAWLSIDSIGERYLCFSKPDDNDEVHALYTAPPQRKPLTEEERERMLEDYATHGDIVRAVEKAHGIGEKT